MHTIPNKLYAVELPRALYPQFEWTIRAVNKAMPSHIEEIGEALVTSDTKDHIQIIGLVSGIVSLHRSTHDARSLWSGGLNGSA